MNIGDKIKYKGFEWLVLDLDGDKVTVIMTNFWKTMPFSSENRNGWKESDIRKALQEDLLPALGEENLITHVTDLVADNGDRRYGTCEDKVWLLSCDEYRKYREAILQGFNFDDEWMWTVTPWYINDVGHGISVRGIHPSGTVSHIYAGYSSGVAPACTINLASLESAPTGAIQKEIDELKTRLKKLEESLGGK